METLTETFIRECLAATPDYLAQKAKTDAQLSTATLQMLWKSGRVN